jgi:hypothetical protein
MGNEKLMQCFAFFSAKGSSSPAKPETGTPSHTRVKRHPIRKRTAGGSISELPTSPPPSYASVASGKSSAPGSTSQAQERVGEDGTRQRTTAELAKIAVIDSIVNQEDLYEVLGVKRNAKNDEIRRGFLNRSRVCHPE